MRNAIVATAMLLAGVATAASAQDTTRAGNQGRADSARAGSDTTIRREGQQAQADSAWRQGQQGDSVKMYGRDSLPKKAGEPGKGEQDAVNPRLDAQGRPLADSTGMGGQRADSSRNPSSTTGATGSAGTTSPYQQEASVPTDRGEWFRFVSEVAKDQQRSNDPSVVPEARGQQQAQQDQQQPGQVDSTRRYQPTDTSAAGWKNREGSEKSGTQPSGATSSGTSSSIQTMEPTTTTGSTTTSGSDSNASADQQTSNRPEVESSSTTGQQGNAANAPGNRDGQSPSSTTTGTSSGTSTSVPR